MNKKTTPSTESQGKETPGKAPCPQKKTLELIKLMARNYCAIPDLPEGLQGMIVS